MPKAAKKSSALNIPVERKSSTPTKKKSSAGNGTELGAAKTGRKPSASSAAPVSGKAGKKTGKAEKAVEAAEIASSELLKQLADNDEAVRSSAVEQVGRRLATKRALDEFDVQKLWKGLWFTMWHRDGPVAQQVLARDLAGFVNVVADRNLWLYISAFWAIMMREWETLDRYRINKYYLLARLTLREIFLRLASSKWAPAAVEAFDSSMINGPMEYSSVKYPHSLRLHLIDIYVDELAQAIESTAKPSDETLRAVLQPFLTQAERSTFKHVRNKALEEINDDERLVEWGIVKPEPAPVAENSDGSDWDGFD